MSDLELTQEFIRRVRLPRTSAAYPHIRYADGCNDGQTLFSRVGWFPTTAAEKPKNIYVLFVGTAEAIEKHAPAITDVRARGNDILVFEFAGQGASGRFLSDPRKVHAMPNGFDMWTDSLKEFLRSDLFRAVRQRGYDHDVNVIDMVNKSLGDMAYNIIDVETRPTQEIIDAISGAEGVMLPMVSTPEHLHSQPHQRLVDTSIRSLQ